MKSPDEAHFIKWNQNPEPSLPEPDGNVVLDASISGQAWLYDVENESEAYLVYSGVTSDLDR